MHSSGLKSVFDCCATGIEVLFGHLSRACRARACSFLLFPDANVIQSGATFIDSTSIDLNARSKYYLPVSRRYSAPRARGLRVKSFATLRAAEGQVANACISQEFFGITQLHYCTERRQACAILRLFQTKHDIAIVREMR